jgi:sialate O-acetylesterase
VHAALFVAVLLTVVPHASSSELQVAGPIGDGAVIQRDAKVPVSGSAAAGAQVVVTFGGASHATRADATGRWRVELPPIKGGGPHEMAIASGEERLLLTDLMVGDVWLCSGQSNMEWSVADSLDAAKEIAAARDHMIHHFQVPRSWAGKPEVSLAGGVWEQTDPGHVGSFTAVGYFFARELRRHLTVPIGLINATWGGSRIEPWMSAPALGLAPADVERILAGERIYEQEVLGKIRARIGDLPDHDEGLVDGRALWADPDLDDSGWGRIAVPSQWEDAGFDGMDGIAWYRTSLELTADEAKGGPPGWDDRRPTLPGERREAARWPGTVRGPTTCRRRSSSRAATSSPSGSRTRVEGEGSGESRTSCTWRSPGGGVRSRESGSSSPPSSR